MKRNEVVKTINNLKGEEGHQKVLEVYNSQKPLPRRYKLQYKDPWCAATVSAVFLMNGYNALSEVSCTMMVKKAKDLGIWKENDAYIPETGDVIMYDWQDDGKGDNMGNPDHVGIVVKVTDKKITVREGNKNNSVGNRTIDINERFIRGFIVPPYEADTGLLDEEVTENAPVEEKAKEEPQSEVNTPYIVGRTYTVRVKTALNVRKGAGKGFNTVGYANLTEDGKKHAFSNGALKNGTRVTVKEVIVAGSEVWLKIPSGWICGVDGEKKFVI